MHRGTMGDGSNIFDRTIGLIGEAASAELAEKTVAVFGLGGVGGYVAEALARSGIGKLVICDRDIVEKTNINRQIYALHSTLELPKTNVAAERIADINPEIIVESFHMNIDAESIKKFEFADWDYIVDAIDDVPAKLLIIKAAATHSIPVISCMGTGNKLDPTKLCITKIQKTHTCPLARKMRYELGKLGISDVDVLFSSESPLTKSSGSPASMIFVPAAAGLVIASFVVRNLIGGLDA